MTVAMLLGAVLSVFAAYFVPAVIRFVLDETKHKIERWQAQAGKRRGEEQRERDSGRHST